MAYGRFRRYRRYRRFRRYRRYFRRRYRRAPINNSSRSRCRVRITNTKTVNLIIPQGHTDSYVMGITPFLENKTTNPDHVTAQTSVAAICSCVDTALYQRFAGLYDEVKVDSMTVNVTLLSPLSPAGAAALTFHTGWDRKCVLSELKVLSQAAPSGGGFYPTASQLGTYSSHAAAVATSNSIPKIVRSIYASDLLEKIQFMDSDWSIASTPTQLCSVANQILEAVTDWSGAVAGNQYSSPIQFMPIFYFAISNALSTLISLSFN